MTNSISPMVRRDAGRKSRLVTAVFGLALIVAPIATVIVPTPGRAAEPDATTYHMPDKHSTQYGLASWYGPGFNHHKTANGERFSSALPTAAHRHLPIGTHVRVTNLKTGKSTTVRVNDRGPYAHNRVIDLSQAAAKQIGMVKKGVTPVKLEVVGHDDEGASAQQKNAAVKQEAAADKAAPAGTNATPSATNAAATPSANVPSPVTPSANATPSASSTSTAQIGAGDHVEKSPDSAAGPSLPVDHGTEVASRQRTGRRL
jgi:rare lipoprotein A